MPATATDTRGRFVWAELLTTDVNAAKDFYGKVVGWTTSTMDTAGMEYTMWMAGEKPIGGVMLLPDAVKQMGAPPHWYAYTEVPDTDATVAQAEQLGAKVLVPAMSVDQVGRFAVLQDPQGAVFAVLTSANPLQEEIDPPPFEFSWHELTTDDLESAVKFYEALFGWKKMSEFDMGAQGVYYMYGHDRFTYGGMMKKAPNYTMPSNWLHYIRVRDTADAAAERATQAGAKLILGPMEVPGGDRVAVLIDPQGAAFAVHSKP